MDLCVLLPLFKSLWALKTVLYTSERTVMVCLKQNIQVTLGLQYATMKP